mmetsp:Transcript_18239/g.56965  ORF Transcript_18239/g.56965 Transcript_18239/m.56965 type:complete len:332 (-) Transcript_18239:94-1089(-)
MHDRNARDVPGVQRLVEGVRVLEHQLHRLHARDVPCAEVFVKQVCLPMIVLAIVISGTEKLRHIRYQRRVPARDVSVLRDGLRFVFEPKRCRLSNPNICCRAVAAAVVAVVVVGRVVVFFGSVPAFRHCKPPIPALFVLPVTARIAIALFLTETGLFAENLQIDPIVVIVEGVQKPPLGLATVAARRGARARQLRAAIVGLARALDRAGSAPRVREVLTAAIDRGGGGAAPRRVHRATMEACGETQPHHRRRPDHDTYVLCRLRETARPRRAAGRVLRCGACARPPASSRWSRGEPSSRCTRAPRRPTPPRTSPRPPRCWPTPRGRGSGPR